jgi:hypothetical protein
MVGCKDDSVEIFDFRPVQVIWTGDPRIDLCGYFVIVDNQSYKPINFDIFGPEFIASEDTIVEMRYKDLKREINACGFSTSMANAIEVLEMR